MDPAFVVRFRPAGPWRMGPPTGSRERVDRILHSDTLFSAVTNAMDELGKIGEWLEATVRNPEGPAVRFSSCFPYLQNLQFVVPPRSLWPPPPSAKVRWASAGFVPLSLVADLAAGKQPDENRWDLDGASGCLLPANARVQAPGPFRTAFRSHAAVDRLTGSLLAHTSACLEFAEDAGLWAVASFADEPAAQSWSEPVKAAFRLLGDSGLGGERSLGWGRSESVEFTGCTLPESILPERAPVEPPDTEAGAKSGGQAYWLLSVYLPAEADAVDWKRGDYALIERGGRIESRYQSGGLKKTVRMVSEGSVILSEAPPKGSAADVAPEGFPHPVFRTGFPVAIPISFRNGTS